MPFGMANYIQAVVLEKTVYIGGGHHGFLSGNNNIVMEYDTSTMKWDKLPPYRACYFAMTALHNRLVLVGGYDTESSEVCKVLGVWRADSRDWAHPYPDMNTARSRSSLAVYKEWLIVAGGKSDTDAVLSTVEVMNTDIMHWYIGPPMPTGWQNMKTAIVGETCYFMGGYTGQNTDKVYGVSLIAIISHLHSKNTEESNTQIWKEISGLRITLSAPLSINDSLLSIGGRDKEGRAVTAIHVYQPDTWEWVKVGDLPSPCYDCTCVLIAENELLVAGGENGTFGYLKNTSIALKR